VKIVIVTCIVLMDFTNCVFEIFAFMCYGAAEIDLLPKFRDSVLVPSTEANYLLSHHSPRRLPLYTVPKRR